MLRKKLYRFGLYAPVRVKFDHISYAFDIHIHLIYILNLKHDLNLITY